MPKAITPENMTPSVQNQTSQFIKQAISTTVGSGQSSIAVFDSANIEDSLRDSNAPQVVQDLMGALPEHVVFVDGGQPKNTAAMVMDSIAKAEAIYLNEHGRPAPAWVADDALRSTLPMVSKKYAGLVGLPERYINGNSVLDDVSSVSGGAMAVSQALTAIFMAYADPIPFGGRIAMGAGLEGKVLLVGHRSALASGEYEKHESLDGLNAGKPFMMAQRTVVATDNAGSWEGVVKHSSTAAAGAPILPSAVQVYLNGLVVAYSDPRSKRSDEAFVFSGTFKFNGASHTVAASVNPLTGVIAATFTPAVVAGSVVEFGACLDYEHEQMKGKRPVIESYADDKSIRATFSSGLYQISQEARLQWNTEVKLDPTSQNMAGLRVQSGAERHAVAISRMWRIASAHTTKFEMDKAARLNERSLASILVDLGQTIDAANLNMIARTNLNGIGVIYVGEVGASYFGNLGREVFESSGIRPRAGTYRLGRLFGKYDIYYSPNRELAATAAGFPLLCIGTSEQVGGNPYITGTALGTVVSPMATTIDGMSGQFYFESNVDSVNPHMQCASSAALINVTY